MPASPLAPTTRFALSSCFSGQVVYPRPALSLYNLAFTALPPFAICLVVDDSFAEDDRHGRRDQTRIFAHFAYSLRIFLEGKKCNFKYVW